MQLLVRGVLLVGLLGMLMSCHGRTPPLGVMRAFDPLGALGGAETSGSSGNIATAENEVVALMETSLKEMSSSQAIMLLALGLIEESSIAENNAKDLSAGALTGQDAMEKKIISSKALNDKISEAMAQKVALNDEAKEQLGNALPPYARGVIAGVLGGIKATAIVKKVVANPLGVAIDVAISVVANPLELQQFTTLVYIAKEAPAMIYNFISTTKTIMDYATYQGVDASPLADAAKSGL